MTRGSRYLVIRMKLQRCDSFSFQRVVDVEFTNQPIDHRVTQSEFNDGCLPRYAAVAGGFDPDDIHCVGYRVGLFGHEVRRLIERHELKAMCQRHFPKQVDAQACLAQYIGDGHRRCQLADNLHLIGLNVAAIWNRIDRGCLSPPL